MRLVCTLLATAVFAACSTVPSIPLRGAYAGDTYAGDPPLATPAPKEDPEAYGPGQGDSLLQLGGQFSRESQTPEGGEEQVSTDVLLQAGLGYFITRMFEVGGQVLGNWTFAEDTDVGAFFLAPYINANFRLSRRFWLYVGPHAGLGVFYFAQEGTGGSPSTSETASDFEYGAHGGARFWVTPRASLFAEGRWTAAEIEFNDVETEIDTTQILVGFNLVF